MKRSMISRSKHLVLFVVVCVVVLQIATTASLSLSLSVGCNDGSSRQDPATLVVQSKETTGDQTISDRRDGILEGEISNVTIARRSTIVELNPLYMTEERWIPYNPSLILLPDTVWSRYCLDLADSEHCRRKDIVVVTLFTKKPGDRYGTTIWMGVTSLGDLQSAFLSEQRSSPFAQAHAWIVPPHMVPNVLGPKAADPRLLILGSTDLAFVAYSAVKETSVIPGMRDYHVRLGVVATQPQREVCVGNSKLPCPSRPPMKGAGGFVMDCNFGPLHCQDEFNLFGVEVQRHVLRSLPQKNLQPILLPNPPTTVAHFVDFSPPDESRPLIYTVDTATGALVSRSQVTFGHATCHDLGMPTKQRWRGSTQIVPLPLSGLYMTIVHAQVVVHRYEHRFLVMKIDQNADDTISAECVHLSSHEVFSMLSKGFYFAVGLAHVSDDRFLVSFGQDNARALVQEVTVSIQTSPKPQLAVSNAFAGLVKRHPPNLQFFTLFVAPRGTVTPQRMRQFVKCFTSIRYHHPGAAIHFFTIKSNSFAVELQELVPFVNIVIFEQEELFSDTPADGYRSTKCNWKEHSDLVRLAILWRWGGTWIDTDDVVIRPIPSVSNVLPYLEWPGLKEKEYWGSHFTLIDGKWKSSLAARDMEAGFHIQNDPLLNFEPANPFLAAWMEVLVQDNTIACKDWGQKVPTDVFRKDPEWASRHLTLLPQYSLLVHPAFGNKIKKGPMFPLYDYRLPDNFPHFDTPVSREDFAVYFQQMVRVQPFFTVKVKDSHYSEEGADMSMRFIPAWIANLDLEQIHLLVQTA